MDDEKGLQYPKPQRSQTIAGCDFVVGVMSETSSSKSTATIDRILATEKNKTESVPSMELPPPPSASKPLNASFQWRPLPINTIDAQSISLLEPRLTPALKSVGNASTSTAESGGAAERRNFGAHPSWRTVAEITNIDSCGSRNMHASRLSGSRGGGGSTIGVSCVVAEGGSGDGCGRGGKNEKMDTVGLSDEIVGNSGEAQTKDHHQQQLPKAGGVRNYHKRIVFASGSTMCDIVKDHDDARNGAVHGAQVINICKKTDKSSTGAKAKALAKLPTATTCSGEGIDIAGAARPAGVSAGIKCLQNSDYAGACAIRATSAAGAAAVDGPDAAGDATGADAHYDTIGVAASVTESDIGAVIAGAAAVSHSENAETGKTTAPTVIAMTAGVALKQHGEAVVVYRVPEAVAKTPFANTINTSLPEGERERIPRAGKTSAGATATEKAAQILEDRKAVGGFRPTPITPVTAVGVETRGRAPQENKAGTAILAKPSIAHTEDRTAAVAASLSAHATTSKGVKMPQQQQQHPLPAGLKSATSAQSTAQSAASPAKPPLSEVLKISRLEASASNEVAKSTDKTNTTDIYIPNCSLHGDGHGASGTQSVEGKPRNNDSTMSNDEAHQIFEMPGRIAQTSQPLFSAAVVSMTNTASTAHGAALKSDAAASPVNMATSQTNAAASKNNSIVASATNTAVASMTNTVLASSTNGAAYTSVRKCIINHSSLYRCHGGACAVRTAKGKQRNSATTPGVGQQALAVATGSIERGVRLEREGEDTAGAGSTGIAPGTDVGKYDGAQNLGLGVGEGAPNAGVVTTSSNDEAPSVSVGTDGSSGAGVGMEGSSGTGIAMSDRESTTGVSSDGEARGVSLCTNGGARSTSVSTDDGALGSGVRNTGGTLGTSVCTDRVPGTSVGTDTSSRIGAGTNCKDEELRREGRGHDESSSSSSSRPFHLYVQIIGPAPSEDKVPPAKRVRLAELGSKPVKIKTTVRKPGVYTVYVTASVHWSGREGNISDLCFFSSNMSPSLNWERPIEVLRFSVPDTWYRNPRGDFIDDEDLTSCRKCGKPLPLKRFNLNIPRAEGPDPLDVRLVPISKENGKLSLHAKLTVHASVPHPDSCHLPCRSCIYITSESSGSRFYYTDSSSIYNYTNNSNGRNHNDTNSSNIHDNHSCKTSSGRVDDKHSSGRAIIPTVARENKQLPVTAHLLQHQGGDSGAAFAFTRMAQEQRQQQRPVATEEVAPPPPSLLNDAHMQRMISCGLPRSTILGGSKETVTGIYVPLSDDDVALASAMKAVAEWRNFQASGRGMLGSEAREEGGGCAKKKEIAINRFPASVAVVALSKETTSGGEYVPLSDADVVAAKAYANAAADAKATASEKVGATGNAGAIAAASNAAGTVDADAAPVAEAEAAGNVNAEAAGNVNAEAAASANITATENVAADAANAVVAGIAMANATAAHAAAYSAVNASIEAARSAYVAAAVTGGAAANTAAGSSATNAITTASPTTHLPTAAAASPATSISAAPTPATATPPPVTTTTTMITAASTPTNATTTSCAATTEEFGAIGSTPVEAERSVATAVLALTSCRAIMGNRREVVDGPHHRSILQPLAISTVPVLPVLTVPPVPDKLHEAQNHPRARAVGAEATYIATCEKLKEVSSNAIDSGLRPIQGARVISGIAKAYPVRSLTHFRTVFPNEACESLPLSLHEALGVAPPSPDVSMVSSAAAPISTDSARARLFSREASAVGAPSTATAAASQRTVSSTAEIYMVTGEALGNVPTVATATPTAVAAAIVSAPPGTCQLPSPQIPGTCMVDRAQPTLESSTVVGEELTTTPEGCRRTAATVTKGEGIPPPGAAPKCGLVDGTRSPPDRLPDTVEAYPPPSTSLPSLASPACIVTAPVTKTPDKRCRGDFVTHLDNSTVAASTQQQQVVSPLRTAQPAASALCTISRRTAEQSLSTRKKAFQNIKLSKGMIGENASFEISQQQTASFRTKVQYSTSSHGVIDGRRDTPSTVSKDGDGVNQLQAAPHKTAVRYSSPSHKAVDDRRNILPSVQKDKDGGLVCLQRALDLLSRAITAGATSQELKYSLESITNSVKLAKTAISVEPSRLERFQHQLIGVYRRLQGVSSGFFEEGSGEGMGQESVVELLTRYSENANAGGERIAVKQDAARCLTVGQSVTGLRPFGRNEGDGVEPTISQAVSATNVPAAIIYTAAAGLARTGLMNCSAPVLDDEAAFSARTVPQQQMWLDIDNSVVSSPGGSDSLSPETLSLASSRVAHTTNITGNPTRTSRSNSEQLSEGAVSGEDGGALSTETLRLTLTGENKQSDYNSNNTHGASKGGGRGSTTTSASGEAPQPASSLLATATPEAGVKGGPEEQKSSVENTTTSMPHSVLSYRYALGESENATDIVETSTTSSNSSVLGSENATSTTANSTIPPSCSSLASKAEITNHVPAIFRDSGIISNKNSNVNKQSELVLPPTTAQKNKASSSQNNVFFADTNNVSFLASARPASEQKASEPTLDIRNTIGCGKTESPEIYTTSIAATLGSTPEIRTTSGGSRSGCAGIRKKDGNTSSHYASGGDESSGSTLEIGSVFEDVAGKRKRDRDISNVCISAGGTSNVKVVIPTGQAVGEIKTKVRPAAGYSRDQRKKRGRDGAETCSSLIKLAADKRMRGGSSAKREQKEDEKEKKGVAMEGLHSPTGYNSAGLIVREGLLYSKPLPFLQPSEQNKLAKATTVQPQQQGASSLHGGGVLLAVPYQKQPLSPPSRLAVTATMLPGANISACGRGALLLKTDGVGPENASGRGSPGWPPQLKVALEEAATTERDAPTEADLSSLPLCAEKPEGATASALIKGSINRGREEKSGEGALLPDTVLAGTTTNASSSAVTLARNVAGMTWFPPPEGMSNTFINPLSNPQSRDHFPPPAAPAILCSSLSLLSATSRVPLTTFNRKATADSPSITEGIEGLAITGSKSAAAETVVQQEPRPTAMIGTGHHRAAPIDTEHHCAALNDIGHHRSDADGALANTTSIIIAAGSSAKSALQKLEALGPASADSALRRLKTGALSGSRGKSPAWAAGRPSPSAIAAQKNITENRKSIRGARFTSSEWVIPPGVGVGSTPQLPGAVPAAGSSKREQARGENIGMTALLSGEADDAAADTAEHAVGSSAGGHTLYAPLQGKSQLAPSGEGLASSGTQTAFNITPPPLLLSQQHLESGGKDVEHSASSCSPIELPEVDDSVYFGEDFIPTSTQKSGQAVVPGGRHDQVVRRRAREEEEERGKTDKRTRQGKERRLRVGILNASLLHLQFQCLGGFRKGGSPRGDGVLERLHLADGDRIIPDISLWSPLRPGQSMPHDALFPVSDEDGCPSTAIPLFEENPAFEEMSPSRNISQEISVNISSDIHSTISPDLKSFWGYT